MAAADETALAEIVAENNWAKTIAESAVTINTNFKNGSITKLEMIDQVAALIDGDKEYAQRQLGVATAEKLHQAIKNIIKVD
jgi:hypothetical protein